MAKTAAWQRKEGKNPSGGLNAKGKPTRKALALKKWGFSSEAAARNFCNRHKKS